MIHQAPVGFDPKTFTGPFLTFLGYAQYLLPLLIAQWYFWAKAHTHMGAKMTVAVTLFVLTFAMIGGIFAATMGMWLPRMS